MNDDLARTGTASVADTPETDAIELSRERQILVSYNSVDKQIPYRLNEKIAAILKRATDAFGITQNAHTLALFTTSGQELNDNITAAEAHLQKQTLLLLRPSTIKGGNV